MSQITNSNNSFYRYVTENEGLTGNNVRVIFQDSEGFIWIGTNKGLNLFDGSKIEIYEYLNSDSGGGRQNSINVLFEDNQHELWIGTNDGLYLFDKVSRSFYKTNLSKNNSLITEESVHYIFEIANSLIVVTSKNIYKLTSQKNLLVTKNPAFTLDDVAPLSKIEALAVDANQRIWVDDNSAGIVILEIRNGKFIKTQESFLSNALNEKYVLCMLFDKDPDILWIGTKQEGIYKYIQSKHQLMHLKIDVGLKANRNQPEINDLQLDKNKNIIIGTSNGLYEINPVEQTIDYESVYLKNIASLPHYINKIYVDEQYNIWIATDCGAVNLADNINENSFGKHLIYNETNSQYNDVLSFCQDEQGNILVGTDGGGLYVYNQEIELKKIITKKNGLIDNVILSQYEDSDSKIWLGTYSQGVMIYNPIQNTFERIPYIAQKKTDSTYFDIRDFYKDHDGNIWVATSGGGILVYNKVNGIIKTFKKGEGTEKNIASDFALNIFEDSKGFVWVCTYEGLSKYDPHKKEFKNFKVESTIKPSLSNNWVYAVAEDEKGNIWVGTENGLNKLVDGERFKNFYVEDGLPGNIVNCIIPDSRGNLWLSTDNGISCFNISKESFANFEYFEGLQGKKYIHNSGFKDNSGKIYFGGFDGFNAFYPDSIKINTYLPKIVLTHFKIDNIEVVPNTKNSPLKTNINETQELILKHNQASFSIEFAVLNYVRSERNQAAYILEGFDKNWISLKTNHPAIYTNLDPGKYIFRVIGSNDFGVWNYKGKELHITILRPWWNTWVMKFVYALIIFLFLYLFRKITIIPVRLKNQLWLDHIQKLKSDELHQHKLQFFTNISHELRTPLTLILSPIDRLMKKGVHHEELNLVKRNVKRLKDLVDQLLDIRKVEDDKMTLNLKNQDVVSFAYMVTSNFKYIAEQKNINLIFDSKYSECLLPFDEDMLEKILTNLIANALKFTSSEGEVRVKQYLSADPQTASNYCVFEVIDSGKGIDEQEIEKIFDSFYTTSIGDIGEIGSGIGLYLTRKLVELHQGTISVTSVPGKGSTFIVKLLCESPTVIHNIVQATAQKEVINTAITAKPDHQEGLAFSETSDKNLILIIDDNTEICEFLVSILSADFDVIYEHDGLKGLKRSVELMPDIIISDVMMPVMDGIELCRRIKTDFRLCHIPVILLTAKIELEEKIKGYETGADEYITKPFNDELLITRVKNLIRQREQLRTHFIGSDGLLDIKLSANSLDKSFLKKIMNIIQENYNNPEFEINNIIKEFGVSRSVFYKKFKALSNQPINDIINAYRLARAAELLCKSQLSVSEIAYKTGFNDPAYFSKVFKKQYKVTPKDFGLSQDLNI